MASIFRQSYTVKDKSGKRIRKKSKFWYIDYKTADETRKRIKGFKDTAAEFNKRLRRIVSRIEVFEKKRQADPKNIEILDKLQNLYMLKSTMSVFKDKILIDSYKKK